MSRRSKRRERRDLKRQKTPINFEKIVTLSNLYEAAKKCFKGLRWKQSVQSFIINLFFKLYENKKKLLEGKDLRQGFICFNIFERGKKREIQSLHFNERLLQKLVCTFYLAPYFAKNFIKENSSSQKGKGTLFAAKLLDAHLRKFLKKYKDGYILIIDFKKYFENIRHEPLIEFYEKNCSDLRLQNFLIKTVTAYEQGIGLGSEISQFHSLLYVDKIDRFIKNKFKYYGRYNDDSYIISENKEKLKEFSLILFKKYEELGIKLNPQKTRIQPLKKEFVFLKTKYKITDTNKIIKKPCKNSVTRAKRRFKRMKNLVKCGKMPKEELEKAFISWRGCMKHRNARRIVYLIKKEITI